MRKQHRQAAASKPGPREYSEGNYVASQRYREAASKFERSGNVEGAARAPESQSKADALQVAAAEAEGMRLAKEEDSRLLQKWPAKPVDAPKPSRPGEPEDE
jgi:hypothetical protein